MFEAVGIDRRVANRRRIAFDLLACALLATADTRLEVAAKLHGAADALIHQVGSAYDEFLDDWQRRDVAAIVSALGADGFEKARMVGARWSVKDGLACIDEMLAGESSQ